jgi:5-methyltetrahydropteroyltriglutamate--homocysteine methyltransferase
MKTYAYGFPRIGERREYKKTIEKFWKKEISEEEAKAGLDKLQGSILAAYTASIDLFPVGEMTAYDPMFDTAIILGVYQPKGLAGYYELCRGKNALEMTKWFNTNYHYLVPDFSQVKNPKFRLNWNKLKEYSEKFPKGIPYVIGPFTFLKLSKGLSAKQFKDYLAKLTDVYKKLIDGFQEVHIDEPAFVLELSKAEIGLIKKVYQELGKSKCKIRLFTYYDSVDFLGELYKLPVASIGLDFVHSDGNLKYIKKHGFPKDKTLIAGLVDGRNVWKTDLKKSLDILKELSKKTKDLIVSNAAPLFHLPITTKGERLDAKLLTHLAFAQEKLQEIKTLAEYFAAGKSAPVAGPANLGYNQTVRNRIKKLTAKDFKKSSSLKERQKIQKSILGLPLFPTTTIGSFPQTSEVRQKRAEFRAGKLTAEEYETYIKQSIKELIAQQEGLGLDVLVHGEFERTDMVEFFAENLDGIATTKNGWIISYGTRGYRPPIIFGDIVRPEPMTVKEIVYAQSLTQKPVKGMLTGPVTIIAWSFVREDIPISDVAYQLALALKDEIKDYEQAGIKIVQIDEPAIREKAPIKRRDWPKYFNWAIKSFRLATNTDPKTQIHTHMCYSEFGEIVDKIDDMDFDVISIETTRSRGDIIEHFEKINFRKQIGLGVWDIHSPAVPSVDDMKAVAQRALRVIPKENFWINPDCGLKTRNWEETNASLKNLVTLSRALRSNGR